jgi:hypothetical protein
VGDQVAAEHPGGPRDEHPHARGAQTSPMDEESPTMNR